MDDFDKMNGIINRILNPDTSETLDEYNTYSAERQYQTILSSLCEHAIKSASNKVFNPHIQLKDNEGNILYNDSLKIRLSEVYNITDTPNVHFKLDFIYDGIKPNRMYCKLNFNTQGKKTVSFIVANYDTPILSFKNHDFRKIISSIIKNELEKNMIKNDKEKIEIQIKALFHNYDRKLKTWNISLPVISI